MRYIVLADHKSTYALDEDSKTQISQAKLVERDADFERCGVVLAFSSKAAPGDSVRVRSRFYLALDQPNLTKYG